jgi:hypothetical protein
MTTLNAALVQALGELRNIPKDKVNPHFKSRFTSLDAILDATRPVLAKHGLALSQEPVFEDGLAGVVTRIIHSGGECRESKLLLPLRDQSAQGVGSCLSYARRYSAAAVLGIASDEDDDGQVASTPPKKVEKPAPVIQKPVFTKKEAVKPDASNENPREKFFKMMDEAGISEGQVFDWLKSKGSLAEDWQYIFDIPESWIIRMISLWPEIKDFCRGNK